ncbi:hypothetical protein TNCV_3169321 [Trichonephila clavipes]|nr:hypothetical protein TNCV_3169321 [Trichonephila clavipes]
MLSIICFLNSRNIKPVEIHRQLVEIYDENVMSYEMVKNWVRQVNDRCINIYDCAWSLLSMMVWLKNEKLNENIPENIIIIYLFNASDWLFGYLTPNLAAPSDDVVI